VDQPSSLRYLKLYIDSGIERTNGILKEALTQITLETGGAWVSLTLYLIKGQEYALDLGSYPL